MFPPVSLPYILPQLPDLGKPGPALREEVVADLFLSSPTPPTPVVVCLTDLILQV